MGWSVVSFAFSSAVGKVLGEVRFSDNGEWADLRVGTREFDRPAMVSAPAAAVRKLGLTDGQAVEFSGRADARKSKAGNVYLSVFAESIQVIDAKAYDAAVAHREARRREARAA